MSSAKVDPPGRTAAPPPRVPSSPRGAGDGFVAAPAERPVPPGAASPAPATTMRMHT
jgi:hypothetical protein